VTLTRCAAAGLVGLLAVTGCGGQSRSATPALTQPQSPTPTSSRPSPSPQVPLTATPAPTQPPTPSSTNSPPGPPPEATVRAYYKAIGGHDPAAVRALLAPEYFADFATEAAFKAWLANYVSLTTVAVQPGEAPFTDVAAQHPGYQDLTVVPVSYQAALTNPSGNEATGSMDRFVFVGRKDASSPWLILDIGSSR